MICQSELKRILSYDENTGLFSWNVKRKRNGAAIGDPAGYCTDATLGYVRIMIKRRSYLAHRLAWLYVHGEMPSKHIDHIDGVRSNNRLGNLRDVSQEINARNTCLRVNNTSGHKGVSFCKDTGKWSAQIWVNKKQKNLGKFQDINDAIAAREKAASQNMYLNRA